MSISRQVFSQLAEVILEGQAKKATKFFSPREVVKATFRGHRDHRDAIKTILFTIGRPNYEERQFIKLCQKAGEPFPIKKIRLKFAKA